VCLRPAPVSERASVTLRLRQSVRQLAQRLARSAAPCLRRSTPRLRQSVQRLAQRMARSAAPRLRHYARRLAQCTGNVPLLLEIESLSLPLPLPLPLLLESLSLRATPAPVVAAVTATSAGFGANTTLSGPAPARFCWVPDLAGDAPQMLEIEALSLLESAAPAPFCSAAGSASASAGDAPLPLEIEALSLLGGATLGAVRPGSTGNAPLLLGIPSLSLLGAAWFVPDAVRVATPELNVCIAPGGPPPCHLLSTRVSTHRPAPRAPARRRGRRVKRSTQSSWSWVMGAPAN